MYESPNINDFDFKLKCDEDPIFFIENVMGYKLSRVHKEMLNTALVNRYVAIEVPVGHSKTTTISKGYVLWRLWREQKGFEICLTSSALEQSMKVLSEIQLEIEDNKFLKELIPNDRKDSWNKKQLTTSKGTKFYVKPFNDSARGIHPDILIYDDILRVGESDLSQQDVKDIFYSVFLSRGQTKRSQHILVGTPSSEGDLFDDIEAKAKAGKQWKHVHYSAITKIKPFGNMNNPDDWLEALWPERFSLQELRDIRENISPARFAREYLCNPHADGTSMFDMTKVASGLDDTLEFEYAKKPGYTVMGLDIAFSQQANSDWTVITIITQLSEPFEVKKYVDGRLETKTIDSGLYLEKIIRFHGVNIQTIMDMYELYECQKIILDKSTGGVLVAQDLRQNGINISEQSFDSASRNMLLLNLWKTIEQERLILPYKKHGNSEQTIQQLVYELKSMQNSQTKNQSDTFKSVAKHDDMVMSLALSVRDFGKKAVSHENMMYSCDINTNNKQVIDKNYVNSSGEIVKLPGFE
jgi:hypothetical protein